MKIVNADSSSQRRGARRDLGPTEGSAMVLVALLLVVLFGCAALALDAGLAFAAQRGLQKSADAAALAAALELPADTAAAVAVAVQYAALNGADLAPSQISVEASDAAYDTVEVELTKTVTFMFAPIIGIDSANVAAEATARIGSLRAATGLVPWELVVPNGGFQFGQTYALKSGIGSGGNYNPLALGGTGADVYQANVLYGASESYEIDQGVDTEPGNMKGPTRSALVERIGSDPYTRWTDLVEPDGTLNGVDDDNPRIITIPTITNPLPGRSIVTITGFALFYVNGTPDTWNGSEVQGVFVKDVVVGAVGPLSSNPLIPRVVSLVE